MSEETRKNRTFLLYKAENNFTVLLLFDVPGTEKILKKQNREINNIFSKGTMLTIAELSLLLHGMQPYLKLCIFCRKSSCVPLQEIEGTI